MTRLLKTTGVFLLAITGALAAVPGAKVFYIGGTGVIQAQKADGKLQLNDDSSLLFECRHSTLRVRYDAINVLEYGQKVDRRYVEAILISPLMLLSKKRTHFLTIGFTDTEGHQQAMVFRVGSNDVRSLLVSLEARTGRRVEYQDDDARRAGKG